VGADRANSRPVAAGLKFGILLVTALAFPIRSSAQTPGAAGAPGAGAPGAGVTTSPTIACADGSATGVIGPTPCTIFARRSVDKFPDGPVVWTVETFPTRAQAERAKTATSAVVEAEKKIWLLTVGPHHAAPAGATREAEIGPLPLPSAASYEIMLAHVEVPPGARSAVHVQSGPEAWYVLSGSQCVETPDTVLRIGQGQGGIVPADTPLFLVATGTVTRRAFFVIVHDAARPFYTEINSWTPRGMCRL
jgi:quercetin dioxygenase-like cupin family protein